MEFKSVLTSRNITAAVILVLIGSAVLWFTGLSASDNAGEYISSMGFNTQLESYSVTTTDMRSVSGITINEMTAEKQEKILKVKILSDTGEVFAKNYLDDRENEINSRYTDTPSPYSAVPGRQIDCPEHFRPNITEETVDGIDYRNYKMYADSSMDLGACSSEQAEYTVKMTTFYCPENQKLLEAAIYFPIGDQTSSVAGKFGCGAD